MKVTIDKRVYDNKALYGLVKYAIKSDSMAARGKLFEINTYDDYNIFRYFAGNGVLSCIKVRTNAQVQ